ncbi:MAG: hypothetical protein FWH15_07450 [Betaproteobacteria bacterium]|nr:hypothetical protein [Betaproteobacteria bacterium]
MQHSLKFVKNICSFAILAIFLHSLTACSETSPDADPAQASPSAYPVEALTRYSLLELSDEPPFTQQDVDAYAEIRARTQYATLGELQGQEIFIELLEAYGLSHKRFYFLTVKIPLASLVVTYGEINYEGLSDSLAVTPEEADIVENSWEKLNPPGSPFLEEARKLARAEREARMANEEDLREMMKKEPPLTQADVDAWLHFEGRFDEIFTYSPDLQNEQQAIISALFEESGLTATRYDYVLGKIWVFVRPLVFNMTDDGASVRLRAEERALLRKNQDKIVALYKKRLQE